MLTLLETYDFTQILQPAQRPEDARQDAVRWAPNITVTKGQAAAIKTADKLTYPMVPGAGDGTQNFVGFALMSFRTDANGLCYPVTSPLTAVASGRGGPWTTMPIFTNGIFDPVDLQTNATPIAQVDTYTPATIEVGDIFTLTYTDPAAITTAVSFTATATTAANVAAGVMAAWNANATLAKIATATAPAGTVVLTAVTPGSPFTVASSTTDGGGANTQTFTRAATTAATGRAIADIQAGRPSAYVMHNGFWRLP